MVQRILIADGVFVIVTLPAGRSGMHRRALPRTNSD